MGGPYNRWGCSAPIPVVAAYPARCLRWRCKVHLLRLSLFLARLVFAASPLAHRPLRTGLGTNQEALLKAGTLHLRRRLQQWYRTRPDASQASRLGAMGAHAPGGGGEYLRAVTPNEENRRGVSHSMPRIYMPERSPAAHAASSAAYPAA